MDQFWIENDMIFQLFKKKFVLKSFSSFFQQIQLLIIFKVPTRNNFWLIWIGHPPSDPVNVGEVARQSAVDGLWGGADEMTVSVVSLDGQIARGELEQLRLELVDELRWHVHFFSQKRLKLTVLRKSNISSKKIKIFSDFLTNS